MDKKTLDMLRFIAGANDRSFDALAARYGADVLDGLEFRTLFVGHYIFKSRVADNHDGTVSECYAATPAGRSELEHARDERLHKWITVFTFVLALLTFLMKVLERF